MTQLQGRPGTLTTALVMTYVGSGLMFVISIWLLITGAGVPVLIGTAVGLAVQAVVQVAAAVYAQRGLQGGRAVLTVVGAINILVDIWQLLYGTIGVLVVLAYTIAVLVLLWRRDSSYWFQQQRRLRREGDHPRPSERYSDRNPRGDHWDPELAKHDDRPWWRRV